MNHWIVDQLVEMARREDGRDWDRYNGVLYIPIDICTSIVHTYLHLHSDLISPPIALPSAFPTSRYQFDVGCV